jgi:hypothetical protein
MAGTSCAEIEGPAKEKTSLPTEIADIDLREGRLELSQEVAAAGDDARTGMSPFDTPTRSDMEGMVSTAEIILGFVSYRRSF